MKLLLIALCTFLFVQDNYGQLAKDYIDQFNRTGCFTMTNRRGVKVGNGTGFFYQANKGMFYITNEHVIGGKFFIDEYSTKMSPQQVNALIPDTLLIRTYSDKLNLFSWLVLPIENVINFYENDSTKTGLLDVVAIPVKPHLFSRIGLGQIVLTEKNINPKLQMSLGSDLFVAGFPGNMSQNEEYPIWKRGTVASEPTLSNVGKSTFLIDATTRAGMSGSPVFYRAASYIEDGVNVIDGYASTFLVGIYRGQSYTYELGEVIRLEKVAEKLAKVTR